MSNEIEKYNKITIILDNEIILLLDSKRNLVSDMEMILVHTYF